MRVSGTLLALALLAGCGTAPDPGLTGAEVDATPRALAAVVIEHVDGEPRREDGSWSDYNDPRSIGAQVDYGVNPEGGEEGRTSTVRVSVSAIAAYTDEELASFSCSRHPQRCEQEEVDGATVIYRWSPGAEEEEPGTYSWTVVREDEVVRVQYEPSGLFKADPRTLDLPIKPDDLRAAALDPAMGLRTTTGAVAAGKALENYDGPEEPPVKPTVVASTPEELADQFMLSAERRATSVRPSTRTEFGPHAVGAHLEYAGSKAYEPFSVDVLTTAGKVAMLDPPPCGVQHSATAVRDRCFGLDESTFVTWTLAGRDRPGVVWILATTYNEDFNRVESSGIRIESAGLTENFYDDRRPEWTARFPLQVWSNVLFLTFRPEHRTRPAESG